MKDQTQAQPQPADWIRAEPALGPAFRSLIRRTVRRGLATWFFWVPLAVGISLLVAARSAGRRTFEATVVLRLTEGTVTSPDGQLRAATVRGYVHDRAFSSDRLLEVMRRHPRAFSDAESDPGDAVQAMRAAMDVAITENDFVEDRGADDPPRSAQIAITFHAGDPDLAITVARELADVVVASTLSIQKQQLARDRAAAASAVEQARRAYDGRTQQSRSGDPAAGGGEQLAEIAREALRRTVAVAAEVALASGAAEGQRPVRFELVDMGRTPAMHSQRFVISQIGGNLAITLLGGLLLAGSFDPRIMGRDDLEALGLVTIGEVPALPRTAMAQTGFRGADQARPSTSA